MSTLVPNVLLFRLEYPIHFVDQIKVDGNLSAWPDETKLAGFAALEGVESFADVYAAWNNDGLYLGVDVQGRSAPFQCKPSQFWKGDNVRLCTDMRNTRDIKRASRYCQQFYFLPSGSGKDENQPVAGASRIHRATEHAPIPADELLSVACVKTKTRYTLEAHVHADALHGWDPNEHPRIGLFIMVEDTELGQQPLTVGDELNWHIDPSMWATGCLTGRGE